MGTVGTGLLVIVVFAVAVGVVCVIAANREDERKRQRDQAEVDAREKHLSDQAAERQRITEESLRQQRERREREAQQEIEDEWRQFAANTNIERTNALNAIERMPGLLETAIDGVVDAQRQFKRRAYRPFWMAIREVQDALTNYQHCIEKATYHRASYHLRADVRPGEFPPFPMIDQIDVANGQTKVIEEQLLDLVSTAQTDFEFASIFEQMYTQQILKDGFRTLSQAIHAVGQQIAVSSLMLASEIRGVRQSIESQRSGLDNGQLRQIERAISAGMSNATAEITRQGRTEQAKVSEVIHQLKQIKYRVDPMWN